MPTVKDALEEWLKNIKGVTCFTEVLRIYAPTCYGECIDAVERLLDRLNKIFGGSTVYKDCQGCWFNEEENRMECEPVWVIEIGHRCLTPEEAKEVAKAIVDYAREANQYSVAIAGSNFYIAESSRMLKAYKKLKENIEKQMRLL